MKIAYIAHPVGGDVVANLSRIQEIIREINLEEPDTVPFAPYFSDCMALQDETPYERERGIRNNIELMERKFVDEVRLYGPRISKGMIEEIKLARRLGLPIKAMTIETHNALKEIHMI